MDTHVCNLYFFHSNRWTNYLLVLANAIYPYGILCRAACKCLFLHLHLAHIEYQRWMWNARLKLICNNAIRSSIHLYESLYPIQLNGSTVFFLLVLTIDLHSLLTIKDDDCIRLSFHYLPDLFKLHSVFIWDYFRKHFFFFGWVIIDFYFFLFASFVFRSTNRITSNDITINIWFDIEFSRSYRFTKWQISNSSWNGMTFRRTWWHRSGI